MKRGIRTIVCAGLLFTMSMWNIYAVNGVQGASNTKENIQEDIDFMLRTLEDVHPNLYFALSKEELQKELDEKLDAVKAPITDIEFYKDFAPTISKLQDGHTTMGFPQDYIEELRGSEQILFADFKIENGKIYIRDLYRPEYEQFKGWKIESINNKKSTRIYSEMMQYVSGSLTGFKESCVEQNFVAYYYLNNDLKDDYMIRVTDGTKKRTLRVNGISLAEAQALKVNKETHNEYYTYQKLEDTVGMITFNSFTDFEGFQQFLELTFQKINNDHISNLIIDLRNNGGGNSELGDLLIEYIYNGNYEQSHGMDLKISNEIIQYYTDMLKDSMTDNELQGMKEEYMKHLGECMTYSGVPSRKFLEQPKFQGDIYFLIGRHTFSSAVMLASTVKDYHIGYLIGEETGGLASSYGDLYPFTLLNTGIYMTVSHKYFSRSNGLNTGRGVLPDYDHKNLGEKDDLDIALEIIHNKTH